MWFLWRRWKIIKIMLWLNPTVVTQLTLLTTNKQWFWRYCHRGASVRVLMLEGVWQGLTLGAYTRGLTTGCFRLGAYVRGFCSRGLWPGGLCQWFMTGWLMFGGFLRKGASVRIAYVSRLMTGGLCPGAFAQRAFSLGAYIKELMTGGLCVGVFCHKGSLAKCLRQEGLMSGSLFPSVFALGACVRGLASWGFGSIRIHDRC